MAELSKRHPENKPGTFYVDTTCIDCDACRLIAPNHFTRSGGQSIVSTQPSAREDIVKVLEATLACPTASIGSRIPWKDSPLVKLSKIALSFPQLMHENVYYCGYHSEETYGAFSYLITHPSGNILIDTPRFAGPLVKSLHKLGGIKYHFLTHIDDIAGHDKFHSEFNTKRIIHQADTTKETKDFEIILDLSEPFKLNQDVTLIPTPGHTPGHMLLHYKHQYLFTGDHIAWSPRLEHLYAFKNHCWYSWDEQIKSMESLLDFRFSHVLPAHGRRCEFQGVEMRLQLQKCIDWMKSVG